jgi:hypothetical protein
MSIRRLRNRWIRELLAAAESISNFFARLKPATQELGTQRMCPYCGLITPRAKRKCLECGKTLGEGPLEPKAAK